MPKPPILVAVPTETAERIAQQAHQNPKAHHGTQLAWPFEATFVIHPDEPVQHGPDLLHALLVSSATTSPDRHAFLYTSRDGEATPRAVNFNAGAMPGMRASALEQSEVSDDQIMQASDDDIARDERLLSLLLHEMAQPGGHMLDDDGPAPDGFTTMRWHPRDTGPFLDSSQRITDGNSIRHLIHCGYKCPLCDAHHVNECYMTIRADTEDEFRERLTETLGRDETKHYITSLAFLNHKDAGDLDDIPQERREDPDLHLRIKEFVMAIDPDETDYTCNDCGAVFPSIGEYRIHQRMNPITGVRPESGALPACRPEPSSPGNQNPTPTESTTYGRNQ